MCRMFILFLLLLQFTTLSADKAYKRPATIFAAGNLKFVFPQIIQEFYKKFPDASVHVQYGSSGYLANSIFEGKEYDVYFAANIKYPKRVYDSKKSATKPKKYAQGLLILFVPPGFSLSEKGIKILASKEIKNITIANRADAPYGVAAMEVIKHKQCCKGVIQKIRFSADVSTAIDNVIWHGDAGFLSKSALYLIPENRKKEGVDWMEIDTKFYSPIIQAYVVSKEGLKNDNARKFLNFLESQRGQKIFEENGYKTIKPE